MSKPRFDWLAARQAYVTGDMTLREIAAQFGCSEQSVRNKSTRDRWADARAQFKYNVARKADSYQSESRGAKLHAWNADDFKLAKAIRAQVAKRLNALVTEDLDERLEEIRALASIAESTQRIARLALGATTHNQGTIDDPDENGVPRLEDFYKMVAGETKH